MIHVYHVVLCFPYFEKCLLKSWFMYITLCCAPRTLKGVCTFLRYCSKHTWHYCVRVLFFFSFTSARSITSLWNASIWINLRLMYNTLYCASLPVCWKVFAYLLETLLTLYVKITLYTFCLYQKPHPSLELQSTNWLWKRASTSSTTKPNLNQRGFCVQDGFSPLQIWLSNLKPMSWASLKAMFLHSTMQRHPVWKKINGFQNYVCHTWISMRKTDFYIMVWHRWYCAETLVCLLCFTNALTIRLTQNCASCSAMRHSKDFLAMPLGRVAASTDFN